MATTKESNLSNLYIELNRFGQNGEYERALKTANKSKIKYIRNYNAVTTSKMSVKYAPYVRHRACEWLRVTVSCSVRQLKLSSTNLLFFTVLQQFPDEEKAFHCKVVCFIQLSRFQDGLKAILNQPKLSS